MLNLESLQKDVNPSSLALFLDIDGVLAPIVDDPAQAAVSSDLSLLIQKAVDVCSLVGIVTGRTLEKAKEMIALDGAFYAGLHGAQIQDLDGSVDIDQVSIAGREYVSVAAQLAQTVGWAYEDKGGTVTIHFRQRGKLGQSVDPSHVKAQLQTVVNPLKVEIHDAKQVLEVKPKNARNKGGAVKKLLTHADPRAKDVIYIGDDLTDVDAFIAMDELKTSEKDTRFHKICVGCSELPTKLEALSDFVLPSQESVYSFIEALIE